MALKLKIPLPHLSLRQWIAIGKGESSSLLLLSCALFWTLAAREGTWGCLRW